MRHARGRSVRFGVALLVTVSGSGYWVEASGQEAGRDQTAERNAPGVRVESVTVSARKREESVQDVPVTLTALSRDTLERFAIQDLNQAATITPNLVISTASSGAATILYIRGIGTSATDSGFDQSVGLVIDDVFYGRGQWIGQGFMDMQQMEVLKGPQTLYFGKNTPAGLINIRTADPSDEFEGYLRAAYEVEARSKIAEGAVSIPVSDTFGIRLAFRGTLSSGWMRNVAGPQTGVDTIGFDLPGAAKDRSAGKDEFVGRVTMKWTPNDALTATLKVQGSQFHSDGYSSINQKYNCQGAGGAPQRVFGVPDPFDPCVLDFTQSRGAASAALVAEFPEMGNGKSFARYKTIAVSGKVEYALNDVTLTSVTGYNTLDNRFLDNFDFSGAAQVFGYEENHFKTFSQELRALTHFDGPVNVMVGAYYQSADLGFRNTSRIAALPADPATGRYFSWDRRSHQDATTYSLFGEVTWNVLPTFELAAGVRYTDETKRSHLQNIYVHTFLQALFSGEAYDSVVKDSDVSPQVTATWHITDDAMIYGAYKQGFKSGGFSLSTPPRISPAPLADRVAALEFKPENVEGFEIGAKATFLDGALRGDLVFYRYTYTDLQVNVFNSETIAYNIGNAGKARTTGIELSTDYVASDFLKLRGSVAYNRGRYADFATSCFAGQTIEQGCNFPIINGVGQGQDKSGSPLPLAPEWELSGGFTYEFVLGDALSLDLNVDGRYTSSYWLDPLQRPDNLQKSKFTIDASLKLHSDDDGWELAVIGRNLTNRILLAGGADAPLTGSGAGLPASANASQWADLSAVTRQGRSVMFQATYRFH